MLSSLTLHDFLLAAMIICLDLYESHNKLTAMSADELQAQVKKYDTLQFSHEIWISRRQFSQDARRASSILAVMLSKVPRPDLPAALENGSQQLPPVSRGIVNGNDQMESVTIPFENFSWNSTTFNLTEQESAVEDYAAMDFNATDPLDIMFNESDNIDWGLVDQYLLDTNDIGNISLN